MVIETRPPKPNKDWRWLASQGEWVRARDPRLPITPKERVIVQEAYQFLSDEINRPASARQVFYNLVSRQIVDNTDGQYNAVLDALKKARVQGLIDWSWIEDRTRKPRTPQQWETLPDFLNVVRQVYRRNVWELQDRYVEVAVEKDALSAIFESELRPYGVTLNVARGYNSWDAISSMAESFREELSAGIPCTLLYFGDFDPSGTDMFRDTHGRLGEIGVHDVEFVRCALNLEHIQKYNLPVDPSKKSDSRHAAHVAQHGDIAVELDALPPRILRQMIVDSVKSHIDQDALNHTIAQQDRERAIVTDMISTLDDYE